MANKNSNNNGLNEEMNDRRQPTKKPNRPNKQPCYGRPCKRADAPPYHKHVVRAIPAGKRGKEVPKASRRCDAADERKCRRNVRPSQPERGQLEAVSPVGGRERGGSNTSAVHTACFEGVERCLRTNITSLGGYAQPLRRGSAVAGQWVEPQSSRQ